MVMGTEKAGPTLNAERATRILASSGIGGDAPDNYLVTGEQHCFRVPDSPVNAECETRIISHVRHERVLFSRFAFGESGTLE